MNISQIIEDMADHVCSNVCSEPNADDITAEDMERICDECEFDKYIQNIIDFYRDLDQKQNKLHSDVDKLYLDKCKEVNDLQNTIIKMAAEIRELCDEIRKVGRK